MNETLAAPTPTLFGTAMKPTDYATAIYTQESEPPADVCVFPVDADDSGVFTEAALYRLHWQAGADNLIVDTLGGKITLQAPLNMISGMRRLLIVHRGELPQSLRFPAAFEPDGAMLLDTGSGATEVRDRDNAIRSQIIQDPPDDIGGKKPALDIIRVERQIAEAGGFIVRITTAALDNNEYLWSFENIELILGQERFARRILQSGKVITLHYNPQGSYTVWEGTIVAQANTLTWVLTEGADLPFSARSSTSDARADSTVVFPAGTMQRLWQASMTSCG
jgi:hypothetical protein